MNGTAGRARVLAGAGSGIAAESASVPTASTRDGVIEGRRQGELDVFLGIPFAAPPVGALRWQPPQPPPAWTAVRDASAYGPDCMQLPFPSDAAPLGTAS